jgi:hypothetical protein
MSRGGRGLLHFLEVQLKERLNGPNPPTGSAMLMEIL